MTHFVLFARVAAFGFIVLGGYIAAMNWMTVIESYRTGRFHSAIPLFGALFLGIGLAILPQTRHFAWTAILLDYGTLLLLYCFPRLIREFWKTSRHNLAAVYRGERGTTTACIKLYRRSILVIEFDFKLAPGETGTTSLSVVGTWTQESQRLLLQVGDSTALFAVQTQDGQELAHQQSGSLWEDNNTLSLVGMEFQRQLPGRG